jgi:hypothetical protein
MSRRVMAEDLRKQKLDWGCPCQRVAKRRHAIAPGVSPGIEAPEKRKPAERATLI